MKYEYIRYEHLKEDARGIDDGQIFIVYTDQKASPFTTTQNKPSVWAFAMKIKGEVISSDWGLYDSDEKAVKHLMNQILFAKKMGWSGTGEKKMSEWGEYLPNYHCIYCSNETQEVEGACPCRGIETKKQKGILDLL